MAIKKTDVSQLIKTAIETAYKNSASAKVARNASHTSNEEIRTLYHKYTKEFMAVVEGLETAVKVWCIKVATWKKPAPKTDKVANMTKAQWIELGKAKGWKLA